MAKQRVKVLRTLAWGLLAFVVGGCDTSALDEMGNDAPGDGGGESGTGSPTMSGLQLSIASAQYAYSVGIVKPALDNRYLVLEVSLANASVQSPLSTLPSYFSVTTRDALVLLPAGAATIALDRRCREDVAVAAGGEAACQLAFELSPDQEPVELLYDTGKGYADSATIPQPASPDTACDRSAKLVLSSTVCQECLVTECSDELTWRADVEGEGARCDDERMCVDACTDCGCAYTCLSNTDVCHDASEAAWACIVDKCAAQCR